MARKLLGSPKSLHWPLMENNITRDDQDAVIAFLQQDAPKVLDSSGLLTLGWRPRTKMCDSLAMTYEWWSGEEHSKVKSGTTPLEGSRVAERSERG